MFLVDSIATFINIGYSAIDSTKGLLRNIGGENLEMLFDKFTSAIGTVIDVLIIASLVRNVGGLRGARAGGRGPFGFGIICLEKKAKLKRQSKESLLQEEVRMVDFRGEIERQRLENLEKIKKRSKSLEARKARVERQKTVLLGSHLEERELAKKAFEGKQSLPKKKSCPGIFPNGGK